MDRTTPESGASSPGSPYQHQHQQQTRPPLSPSLSWQVGHHNNNNVGSPHHEHHHRQYSYQHRHHRPTSYSPTRSRSASARRRRGSGVFFNAIPAQSGLLPETFQRARKTEEEIQQISGRGKNAVQQYYRDLNELLDAFQEVEEVLESHREYERQRVENVQRKRREQLDRLDQLRDGTADGLIDIGDELRPSAAAAAAAADGETLGSGMVTPKMANAPATPSPLQQRPMIIEHSPAATKTTTGGATNGYGSMTPETQGSEDAPPTSIIVHAGENEAPEASESSPLLAPKPSKRSQSARMIELAINISMLANVTLVLSKIWTVVMSASLAVLASMIDSLMDLLSGCIVWYSVRMRKDAKDGHNYPVGKARMEPLGVIVFGSIMMTSFAQVLLQSVERLLAGEEDHPVELDRITLILLAANILIKLALWLWCRTIKNSSSVQALAQDHYIDVIFNVFSTFFPVAGKFLNLWWLDAAGAIALSLFIIYKWAETCLDNIRRLTGHVASAKDVQQLTYMAYRFSDLIEAIDTVRSYYVGDGLFVEVDIVMARDSPLPLAHDIGESLQEALECLDNVERAFVHIDIDVDHEIEHRKALNRLLE